MLGWGSEVEHLLPWCSGSANDERLQLVHFNCTTEKDIAPVVLGNISVPHVLLCSCDTQ